MDVDVVAAAEALGISRRAVLDRIASGALPARQVGRMWLVDRSDLDLAAPSTGGRRLSARSAWAVLAALDLEGLGDWSALQLSRSERQRARARAAVSSSAPAGLFAGRAVVSHWRVHPSMVDEVVRDSSVVAMPMDVGGLLRAEQWLYVPHGQLEALERRWPISPVAPSSANLVVREARAAWPFRSDAPPASIAAADLLDGGDARGVHEAHRIFESLAAGL